MSIYSLQTKYILQTCLIASATLFLLPWTISAQESEREAAATTEVESSATLETERCGVGEDCDDTHSRVAPESAGDLDGDGLNDVVEPASYNNSRSNRSTVAAPEVDTNVCDGVTCPDGSCAATAAECPVERSAEMLPPTQDLDSDGDGLDDGTERANYNNTRSNRSGVRDADSDGDGLSDDVESAQNHNSSRSNRTSRAAFSDTDTDGRTEVMLRGESFVAVESDDETAVSGNGRVKCWSGAEGDDGQLYAWGQGVCVASDAAANASDTAQARLDALQVRGEDIRAWTEEQQAAWREFRENRATSSVEEQLLGQMVETANSNARVQEITSDDDGLEMQYQAEMRLFGLISMERTVSAKTNASGEVEVDYPWYRFLSRVPEQSSIRNILTDLHMLHGGGGGAGKVSL